MALYETYNKTVIPALQKELDIKNVMAVPKVEKIVINVGLGKGLKDSSFIDTVEQTLIDITGQKPIKTKAKKSISNFKVREGMVIGMKVTLRGKRMYDFMEKFIRITLPRVRDFRGLKQKAVDEGGNLTVGVKENIAFPEIKADAVEKLHGLEITFVSNAENREEGLALFKALGFPFKK